MAQAQQTRAEKTKAERRRRREFSPTGHASKFDIPESMKNDPEYRYHWAYDEGGRIQQMKEQDWDIVDDESVAEDDNQKGLGVIPARFGGTDDAGKNCNMILMRKPRKYDEEDKAKELAVNEQRMAAIQRGQAVGPDGRPHQSSIAGSHKYTPGDGISITRGN